MNFLKSCGLIAACAFVPASAAWAQDVTLRYSNWLPSGYYLVEEVMKPWIADVEEVTEGRVTVEMLPKVVGTVTGQYDVLADGLADLSLWVPGYSSGRFVLMEGFELPFLGNDPIARSEANWNTYQDYVANTDELADIHVISVFSSNSAHIVTREKRMTAPDMFRGERIRTSSSSASEMMNLLGAAPVPKPMSELYELASGGVVDGATMPVDTIPPFKLNEVFKAVNLIEGGLTNNVLVVGMNRAKWDQISPEDQAAITEVSGITLARLNGEVLQRTLDSATEQLEAEGITFNEATPEEFAAMKETLRPIWDNWIALAKENGLEDPEAFLDSITATTGAGY
ncbi:MAG: TRAP transporter substrate-binding protein [Pseudomonadota bacterium]|nr:TRAP transporter substrate-binding protein [Pseudomonadota bacterium]